MRTELPLLREAFGFPRTELPLLREAFGFPRTECGCEFCKAYCRHLPGALDPADLARLCPPGQDVFAWAEQHLRALAGRPEPALVPARRATGECHWYFGGKCAVHADAPYGCAFFDAHLPQAEVDRRAAATLRAIAEDAAAQGLYWRVWRHLKGKGLVGRRGDRAALAAEFRKARRAAERSRARAEGA
jgi:hypothetical protein